MRHGPAYPYRVRDSDSEVRSLLREAKKENEKRGPVDVAIARTGSGEVVRKESTGREEEIRLDYASRTKSACAPLFIESLRPLSYFITA